METIGGLQFFTSRPQLACLRFDDIAPHLIRLSNSIHNFYKLSSQKWPEQWTQSFEVLSVQQGNGDDCWIFTMLNAYYGPRGIDRPPMLRETHVSNIYRGQLALCLLENERSFP